MIDSKELSRKAAELYEAIESLDCFKKQDVVAILVTMVELDVRRHVRETQARR